MVIQLVDIFYSDVFKRYSAKYNIFRDLYENDLLGLEIRSIDSKLASRIKSIILSNKEICYVAAKGEDNLVDLLSLGSLGVFKELSKEISAIGNEDLGFKIKKVLKNTAEFDEGKVEFSNKSLPLMKAHVMGIVNVTPDSFSDGGKYFDKEAAIEHGLKLFEDGAEILDIGGESSRPGAEPITVSEEIQRVIPVIENIVKYKPDIIISIDTVKSEVAEQALSAGAKIVNDISSFSIDKKILEVAKKYNAGFVLMHMKGNPQSMQNAPYYDDVVSDIYDYLDYKATVARKYGIKNIFIDPGIGFGKSVSHNFEILKRLNEFKGIGSPMLVGVSKKSFLGKPLNLTVNEREDPTLIAESIAIKNGARFIRTHNVKKAVYSTLVTNFIENPESITNV